MILLTARAEVADRVEGLDLGATDYVTKPFAFEELLARIRARLRESDRATDTTLEAAGIRLDLLTREATPGRRRRAAARPRGRAARLPDAPRRSGLHAARRSSPRSGTTTTTPAPTSSRSTSATCGASWRGPVRRRRSRPCARSATGCGSADEVAPGAGSGCAVDWRSRSGRSSSLAFAVVFVAVRAQMSHESAVIKREEDKEKQRAGRSRWRARARARRSRRSRTPSPTSRRPSSLVGAATLAGGAARRLPGRGADRLSAAPLRRHRDRGRRRRPQPRGSRPSAADAAELRTLAEAFNHMLDRLDDAFARQRQLRLRRLARAAQPADRDPRPDRSARPRSDPERRGGAAGRGASFWPSCGRVERLVEDAADAGAARRGRRPGARRGRRRPRSCASSPSGARAAESGRPRRGLDRRSTPT